MTSTIGFKVQFETAIAGQSALAAVASTGVCRWSLNAGLASIVNRQYERQNVTAASSEHVAGVATSHTWYVQVPPPFCAIES
jgi:hypothetical protein